MPSLRCRECRESLNPSLKRCVRCGVVDPFACTICGKPAGELTSPRDWSISGRPLCNYHRRSYCSKCAVLMPEEQKGTWRVTGYDETSGKELREYLCPACNANHLDPPKPQGSCALLLVIPLLLLALGVAAALWH